MNRLSHILIIGFLSLLSASLFGQHVVMENIVGNGTDDFVPGDALLSGISNSPGGIAIDTSGNYYFTGGLFAEHIYKYDIKDKTISRFLVNEGITGLCIDKNNYLYYCLNSARSGIFELMRIDLYDMSETVIAGTGTEIPTEDGVLATETGIVNPFELVLDPQNENLYYISFSDFTLRRINLESGFTYKVAGIAGVEGDAYIADGAIANETALKLQTGLSVDIEGRIFFGHNRSMIKMIDVDGKIYHYMGTEDVGYSGDGGLAINAQFEGATFYLRIGIDGDLLLSDFENFRIRKIDASTGIVTTFAGTGNEPYSFADDESDLYNGEYQDILETNIYPFGIIYNEDGELIICDRELRIRRIFTCKNPDIPVTSNPYKVCKGEDITFEIDADLNDATEWSWYKEGCLVGEKIGSSAEFTFVAEGDASYFVLGTGGCSNSEECAEFIVENECLEYYNTFTPNGDGINDYFDIPLLENYPENEVVFYNRWGDQLETIKNYDNTTVYWSGTNGGGDRLAAGTYFFTATSGSEKIASGWIQIILD